MSDVSLADIVKAARERKKREALAQQFLGSQARKANAPGAGAVSSRPKDQKPSLLSRTSGIQKQRSSSARPAASNIDGKWQHDLHRVNNPNGPGPKRLNRTASTPQIDRNTRNFDKFASALGRNAQNARDTGDGPGFNIRGVANRGPYTIVASNFAQGTTGSDIEQVMAPHGRGSFISARIITPGPTVMAEIDFETIEGADNVIQIFNGKKVCLSVYGTFIRAIDRVEALLANKSSGRRQSTLRVPQERTQHTRAAGAPQHSRSSELLR